MLFQITLRKSVESTLRQLEREKALLQHKNAEYQRKADHEADKKRNLENDGLWYKLFKKKNIEYICYIDACS